MNHMNKERRKMNNETIEFKKKKINDYEMIGLNGCRCTRAACQCTRRRSTTSERMRVTSPCRWRRASRCAGTSSSSATTAIGRPSTGARPSSASSSTPAPSPITRSSSTGLISTTPVKVSFSFSFSFISIFLIL